MFFFSSTGDARDDVAHGTTDNKCGRDSAPI